MPRLPRFHKFPSNDPATKRRRKKLRNNMPPAERVLWQQLRNRKLNGLKFRRQHAIEPFILDFYCPERRLAIEIDGDSHGSEYAQLKDEWRQSFVEQFNIKVLRFTNDEIYNSLYEVLQAIKEELEKRKKIPPPTLGGG